MNGAMTTNWHCKTKSLNELNEWRNDGLKWNGIWIHELEHNVHPAFVFIPKINKNKKKRDKIIIIIKQ